MSSYLGRQTVNLSRTPHNNPHISSISSSLVLELNSLEDGVEKSHIRIAK